MKKQKALFIYTHLSTFVKGDIEILSEICSVKTFRVDNSSRVKQFFSLIGELLYLILNIWKFDIIYIWFADYHSFLPVMLSKITKRRSFLVIGGYDVCRIKSVKYGSFINPIRGFMTRYSMNNASLCLCVSNYIDRVVRFISKKAKTQVVYNCVNIPDDISDNTITNREKGVISVAIAKSPQSIFIKGIDRIVRLSQELKNIPFTLIGTDRIILESICGSIPQNLKIISRIPHEELLEYYKKYKVYCQLSRSESFAVALAEAMYYNCVPVVSNTGGMTEVTGSLGYVVDGENINQCSEAILSALDEPYSEQYRQRIESNFSIRRRYDALKRIFSLTYQDSNLDRQSQNL